jgi:hypothetical protein
VYVVVLSGSAEFGVDGAECLVQGGEFAGRSAVQEEYAVEVVVFVLQCSGEEPGPVDGDGLVVDVDAGDVRADSTAGPQVCADQLVAVDEPGDGQATFHGGFFFVAGKLEYGLMMWSIPPASAVSLADNTNSLRRRPICGAANAAPSTLSKVRCMFAIKVLSPLPKSVTGRAGVARIGSPIKRMARDGMLSSSSSWVSGVKGLVRATVEPVERGSWCARLVVEHRQSCARLYQVGGAGAVDA